MYRIEKLALYLLVLLIVCIVGSPFVSYWRERPHQREIQHKVLNASFAQAKPVSGKVMLICKRTRAYGLLRTSDGGYFDMPEFFCRFTIARS